MTIPSDDERDLTSDYEVTRPPTGGPGRWPTEMASDEARASIEQLIRDTEEPASRVALRLTTVVVLIVIVVAGTITWDDLDGDIARNEARIAELERQVAQLQSESGDR